MGGITHFKIWTQSLREFGATDKNAVVELKKTVQKVVLSLVLLLFNNSYCCDFL